jgi:thiamine-phosphate diphosphorylase
LPAAHKRPVICYVTDRHVRDRRATDLYATERYSTERALLHPLNPDAILLQNISAAIEAGVDWVQLREKDMAGRELVQLTRAIVDITKRDFAKSDIAKRDVAKRDIAKGDIAIDAANEVPKRDIADRTAEMVRARSGERLGTGARVIVNDRLDVALAAGAAGVHLGGDSASVVDVARWCRAGNAPAGFLIGVSCHSIAEARQAEKGGADYVFFGPVFDTPSKRQFGSPQGIRQLADVCRALTIPVIAIGGINKDTAMECVRAGAAGVAAIRLFQEMKGRELGEILARIDEGP